MSLAQGNNTPTRPRIEPGSPDPESDALDLASDNEYTGKTLVKLCLFIIKILSKNQILTSIKGRNSGANLRKTTIYKV